MNTGLKGTGFVLVTLVLQVILMLILLFLEPVLAIMLGIDLLLIILTFNGFRKGVRGWAIFAIIYGALALLIAIVSGSYFNISIFLIIGGIIGLTTD